MDIRILLNLFFKYSAIKQDAEIEMRVDEYTAQVDEVQKGAALGLADLCRQNLRQLLANGYRGRISLGRPNNKEHGPYNALGYTLHDGYLRGTFLIDKPFLGSHLLGRILPKIEQKEVNPNKIPF